MIGIRILGLIALALMLSSCAAPPAKIEFEGIKSHSISSFAFVDARPSEEMAGGVQATQYAELFEYGDDQLTPSRMAILRARLHDALGDKLAGRTVTVKTFRVWVNRYKSDLSNRSGGYVPSSGSLGADIIGGLLGGLFVMAIEDAKLDRTVGSEITIDVGGKLIESVVKEGASASAVSERVQEVVIKSVDGMIAKVLEHLQPTVPVVPSVKEATK